MRRMTERRTLPSLRVLATGMAVFAALAFCCMQRADAADAMYRGGPRPAGVYSANASAEWVAGVRFTVATGGPIRSTPVVDQGRVFFGSNDGYFYAIDANTGAPRWKFATGGAVASSPATDGRLVFFASRDGMLYAVNAADGALKWKHRFGAELGSYNYWDYKLSSPVLADGRVFIGSGDGHVYAFSARDGRLQWQVDAGARVRSTPAVADGLVVFGTLSGHVRAVRERDGVAVWTFATAGAARTFDEESNDTTSVVASPTIAAGSVFVGGRDGFLYALDLRDGRQRWRTTHDGSSWILSTGFAAETLFVGSGSAKIVQAADPATGAEKWRFPTQAAVFSSLTLSGNTILFSDFLGTVTALDRASGALRWQFPMGGRSLSTPVVAGGLVYCASDKGVLFALEASKPPAANAVPARRIVFSAGKKTPKSFAWFTPGLEAAIAEQFKAAGYETLDTAQLAAFMSAYQPGAARAVVVFADNRIPAELAQDPGSGALVRRFLDAGGKVALLGPNPLAYVSDPQTDEVTVIDFAAPRRVFGVPYPDLHEVGGYYANVPTADGRRMGLRSGFVGFPALTPDEHITALANDEYGKASAWLRSYGGPPGTGLLQLSVPRQELSDLSEIQAAIEYGITW